MTDPLLHDPSLPGRRAVLLGAPAVAAAIAAGASQAAAAPAGLTVIAEIVAKPEHAAEVRAALTPLAANARGEPGCLHYSLYEDADTPGRFFTFERWTDEAALDAHLTSPAMRAAGPRFAPLMGAPLALHKLKPLSA